MQILGAARIFASHYQLVICDDPGAFSEASNWGRGDVERGFAGNEHFWMVGTEADLNDHWVEVAIANEPPAPELWQRITCVGLRCSTGQIHVMSVIDDTPPLTLSLPQGEYSVFVADCNFGVDQLSLGEDRVLTDEQLAQRQDLEWYRIVIVPGKPLQQGRLKDD